MDKRSLESPVLSIVMPIYNGDKYLNYSIQSILNQTYQNYELILVDDGSTDHSLEICKKYQLLDKRIKVYSQRNSGVSEARNKGIDKAIGKYITFMDSDDIAQPRMYEIMLKHMISDELDLIMCEAERKDDCKIEKALDQYEVCELTKKDLYQRIFSNSNVDWEYMSVWNKIYKTDYAKKIKFAQRGTEDAIFNCQYFRYVKKAELVKQKLYYWIQRNDSVSHSEFGKRDCLVLQDYYWMNQYIHKYEKQYTEYVLIKLYKRIFNSRYRGKHTEFSEEIEQIIRKHHKEIKKHFYNNNMIERKTKVLFTIFYYIPISYSMFCWINEKRKG